MGQITRVVIMLTSGDTGYVLEVKRNVAGSHGTVWESLYTGLLWSELVDVLLAECESTRPGWELDEALRWSQPPLWG